MAIALKNGMTASNASATTTLVTGSMGAVAVGDYVLVALAIASGSITVTLVTDLAGNTYARRASTVNARGVRTELWSTVATGANANNTVTLTPSSSVLMAMCVESYTGPTALGNTQTATGTDTLPNAALVLQDPYNWNVGAFGFVCVSGDTIAQKQGTRERYVVPVLTSVGCSLIDTTQPGPGTVPVMGVLSTSRAWAIAAVELRSGAAAGAYTGIPAATAVVLGVAAQASSTSSYREPDRDAAVIVSSGGSSGATFF